jgi:hypothetical protein
VAAEPTLMQELHRTFVDIAWRRLKLEGMDSRCKVRMRICKEDQAGRGAVGYERPRLAQLSTKRGNEVLPGWTSGLWRQFKGQDW